MSAPAKGHVRNPQSTSSARHPYLQSRTGLGRPLFGLMADPYYRAILFRDNAKELAAAGYTEESERERDYEYKHGNPLLSASKDEVPVHHKEATTARGWHEEAKTIQRGKLPARCLLDAVHNKYPVCGQDGVLDCRALIAAKRRAHINAVHGVPGAGDVETATVKLMEAFCEPTPSGRKASRKTKRSR